jgi:CrcB protein
LNLLNFTVIGLGAALGAWSRWLLGLFLNPLLQSIPLGTLAANLIGAYLVGLGIGFFHLHADISPALKLFAITGFLGGLTTFSSFSAETVERFLAGQSFNAVALIGLHLLGSLFMTWLGFVSVGAQHGWN